MPNFTFDAPEHHTLTVDGHVVAHGGEEFTVNADVAERLLLSKVPLRGPEQEIAKLKKEALLDLVAARGLDPEELKTKTKPELIEILEQPVADHTTTEDAPPANTDDKE